MARTAIGRRADKLALRYAELMRRREEGAESEGELEGVKADLATAIRGLVRAEVKRVWQGAGCRCAADRDDLEGWLWRYVWDRLHRYDGRASLSSYLRQFCFRAGRTRYQRLNRLVLIPTHQMYAGKGRQEAGECREAADRVMAATASDAELSTLPGREESAGPDWDIIEAVRAALAAIPDRDRELLMSLRDFGGDESIPDKARSRGQSRQAVSQLTRRILDRLRVRLEAAGITQEDCT